MVESPTLAAKFRALEEAERVAEARAKAQQEHRERRRCVAEAREEKK